MVVLVIENAPEKLRGTLTRWLLEVKPGVFTGSISAGVRDRIWRRVTDNMEHAGALLIFSADTEQGFRIEMCGYPKRSVIDIEGIQLIKVY